MQETIIQLDELREIAKRHDLDALVVVAFRGTQYQTLSYGRDRATCKAFAQMCDQIHDDIADGTIPIPEY